MATDARQLYVTALQNTHALEMQALEIMKRQIGRLQHYPEVEDALRRHVDETEIQRRRLEAALDDVAEKPSTLKEGFLGFVGNMMALGHTPAQDEILKNMFANQAFENFEIAAYRSLIGIAEASSLSAHIGAFQTSLQEEEAMAKTVAALVRPVTDRYVQRTLSGEKADR